jgi:hypothetical protein
MYENRDIFLYFDGERERFGDPLRIRRRFYNKLDGNPKAVIEQTKSPVTEDRDEAHEKLNEALVYAFDLQPFDPATGEGVLEEDLRRLFKEFFDFLDAKKKRLETSPTSSQPMESYLAQ